MTNVGRQHHQLFNEIQGGRQHFFSAPLIKINPRINNSIIYDPGVHSSRSFMLSLLINCDVRGFICTLGLLRTSFCPPPPGDIEGKVIRTGETGPSCTGSVKQRLRLQYIKACIMCFVLLFDFPDFTSQLMVIKKTSQGISRILIMSLPWRKEQFLSSDKVTT